MSGKRSIFEEVGNAPAQKPAAQPGLIDKGHKGARGAIRVWLVVLFVMVAAMILVGGLTRLTDSGLSITEWRPVTGALPPMNEAAWAAEFEKYQQIPEYQLQNKGMSLSEFKTIYWWEWGHRQLGRAIGLVWALGFVFFAATRKIPTGWSGRLLGIGILGGAQGAIGWWMVSSGLTGSRLDVASYRLATHLGLAFVILGFIGWYVLMLSRSEKDLMQARRGREAKLFSMGTGLMHFAFLQILLGALVAGIDAGRGYTDWPLMAGGFFPPDMFELTPVWRNFFEDDGLVQFMHRIAGYLLLVFGIIVWRRGRKSGNIRTRAAFDAVLGMLVLQAVLGIATVMHSSPLHLAILHQLGAILLWVLILRARFSAQYPTAQSVRG
ncbi:heme A synthase [Actibacterium sp. XHP0104]|uniref:heme A synthase n=1 Tax=Actibacterium sp. XHP0104 TaxID=2984335 RepID=UPI0021E7CEDF|nr:heme A synthase [Actibacterium sp. XHP0104]MCV2881013.1 COX15/CtaA family protein [Actibacterium sp. XHP0104]